MKKIVLIAGLLSGCVYNVPSPQFASDHPGNPEAQSAPLPNLSRSLAAYDPAAAPDPEAPEMDHGAMGHGSMKGMDHGAGQDEQKTTPDHEAIGHGSQMAAADRGQKTNSMKGMDHGAHWMAPADAAARNNPIPANAVSIARGKKLFGTNCVTCHGKEGRGDGPAGEALDPKPADLTAMAGHHSDGDYAWKIANGRGAMPAWKSVLDDKQIWDVVNFVQSLGGGKKSDARHDQSKHKH